MGWQFTAHTIPIFIGGVISGSLAVLAWHRRRSTTGVGIFALMMLAVTEWSFGYALELAAVNLPTKIFWAKVQYLGIVTVPVMWLCFALQYTGREKWLTRRNLPLLAIIPFITLLLAWTSEAHGLLWADINLFSGESFSVIDVTYGAWFWVHTAYSYLSLLLGALLFIYSLIDSPQLYRGQTAALLIGVSAPWVGNGLYLFDLTPFPHLDLTPFAFTITGLAVSWSLFRYRMLDIVPMARSVVMEFMEDGVIVLDRQDRVVDFNLAASSLFGCILSGSIGQPIIQVLASIPTLATCCQKKLLSESRSYYPPKTIPAPWIYGFHLSVTRMENGGED